MNTTIISKNIEEYQSIIYNRLSFGLSQVRWIVVVVCDADGDGGVVCVHDNRVLLMFRSTVVGLQLEPEAVERVLI